MTPTTSPEQPRGDSLLVSRYNLGPFRYVDGEGVAVIHILETAGSVPVTGGYNRFVECDRAGRRKVVQEAIEYAREHGLRMQIYSRHVRADIEAGFIDAHGISVHYMVGGPA